MTQQKIMYYFNNNYKTCGNSIKSTLSKCLLQIIIVVTHDV